MALRTLASIPLALALIAAAPAPSPSAPPAPAALQEKTQALMADARPLWDTQKYDEAEILLREATLLDPQNQNAAFFLRIVDAKINDGTPADELQRKTKIFVTKAADLAARDFLRQNMSAFALGPVSLEQALRQLNNSLDRRMDIHWPALNAAGIERNAPITITLRDASCSLILTTILAQAARPEAPLGFTVDGGAIVISTRDDLLSPKYQAEQSFDIRDILILGGGKPSTEAPASLIETIKSTVDPDTWKDAGGKVGTIRFSDGMLVVHQTRDNLVAVSNLIEQLRQTRGIDIAIETRLILVSNNFLDDFRIGWDLSLPVDDPPASAPVQAAATKTVPRTFSASIIDNWTLTMLLQATAADKRTLVFTPPRTTTPNGYGATIETTDAPDGYSQITSYPMTVGPAAVGEPAVTRPAKSPVGIALHATATASADRRSVILSLDSIRDHPPAKGDAPAAQPAGKPTAISIPDGGTLVIGIEKVRIGPDPKDERTALLLIRSNIITHKEIVDDLFGPGYDKPTGLPPSTAPTTAPAPADTNAAILRDRALTLYTQAMKDANGALAQGDEQAATRAGEEAINEINDNLASFSEVERMGLRDAAQTQIDRAKAAAAEKQATLNGQPLRDLVQRTPQDASTAAELRRQKVADLIAQARRLYDTQQLSEAQDLLRQATILDPQDEKAALFLRIVDSKIADNTSSATVPATPQDAADKADAAARDHLENTLKLAEADGQALEKLLNYLQDSAGVPFDINWPALEAAGIRKTTPITIHLRDWPVRKVLTTALSEAGDKLPADKQPRYTIENGRIIISTQDDLLSEKHQSDGTFDVRDLLTVTAKNEPSPDDVKSLIDTVKATVGPDTWKDTTGTIGTIREADGMLVVHQTRENLHAIDNLIKNLRETRGMQVAVTSRLLLVSNNFLDDFRIGWDTSIPNGAAPATAPATRAGVPRENASFSATIPDNWTLTMLLQATQADKRTFTFMPPALKIPSGHQKTLDTDIARPVFGPGPTIGPAPSQRVPADPDSRVTLDITPAVSADRKSVVLAIANIAINPATPASAAQPATESAIAPAQAKPTQITVPDGATLLIGIERIRTGPGPNDIHTGLLLIRPDITTHKQIEDDLFGPGYDKPTGLPPSTAPTTAPATAPATAPSTSPAHLREKGSTDAAILRERALTLFKQDITVSNDALAKGDFQPAIAAATKALNVINENTLVFSDVERMGLVDAAQREGELAKARQAQAAAPAPPAMPPDARQVAAAAAMLEARRLWESHLYLESQEKLITATSLDPTNEDAALFLRIVAVKISDVGFVTSAAEGEDNAAMKNMLEGGTCTIEGNDLTLQKALDQLSAAILGMAAWPPPINVDWAALKDAGIDGNSTISLHLEKVRYRDALENILLQLAATHHARLIYDVQNGTVVVSAAGKAVDPRTDTNAATAPATAPSATNPAAANATKQKVASLTADARKLYDAKQFKEAQYLLKQATALDPQDQDAADFLRVVTFTLLDMDYQAAIHPTTAPTTQDAAHLIPYANLDPYPEAWPELQHKLDPAQIAIADKAARDRLAEVIKDVTVDQRPLEKVFNYLRDDTGTNVFINWPALQTASIDKNTPITLALKNITFQQTLDAIFTQLALAHHAQLAATIDDGIITISLAAPSTTQPTTSPAPATAVH